VLLSRRTTFIGFIVVATAAVAGTLASTSSSSTARPVAAAAGKTVRIAYFLGSLSNSYQKAQLTGLQAGAKKYGGVVAKVYDSKDFTAPTQVNQLQDAITSKKYDAFVIAPNDGGAIAPTIRQAIAAGIKVACISANCGPDPIATKNQIPGMVTTIALPFFKNGQMIANLIVKACAAKNPCNVVYMPGINTLPLETARNRGLDGVLKAHPNIKIVARQEGKYDLGTARSVMQNILTANQGIDVAASAYDVMTNGIEQAIKAAGVKQPIKLIGSGGGAEAIAAIRAKRWFGTVAAVPQTEGQLAAKYVIAAVHGQKGIPGWVDEYTLEPGGALVTPANAATFKAQYHA
jgi:ribose transport system substrate-binding protein